MKQILTFIALFCAILTYGQTHVTSYGLSTMGKEYGVVYCLPKTEIQVIVKAEKTVLTPGEYAQYANRYLRLNNVTSKKEVFWNIKSVQIKSIGVANPSAVYFIEMRDKTVAPLLQMTKDGMLHAINMPFSRSESQPIQEEQEKAKNTKLDSKKYMTEDMLMANSSAKVAELVAQEIYNIRESKNILIKGQADYMPQDGSSLQIMLDNLNKQEAALTQLFKGTKETQEKEFTLKIEPKENIENKVLFRFSKLLGMLDADDLAGEPYYLSLKDLEIAPKVDLSLENKKKKELDGVAYNVPGKGLITLSNSNKTLIKQEILVTQFGNIEYLASTLFEKRSTIKVLFDPNTGGLIKIDRKRNK